jgi:Protein of unknown function (DUF3320)
MRAKVDRVLVGRIGLSTPPSGKKTESTAPKGVPVPIAPAEAARPAPRGTADERATYVTADVASIARPNRERFHDPDYTPALKAMVAHVVGTEGPILEDLLVERIARAHDLQRSGNQIRRRVMGLLPVGSEVNRKGDEVVVWPAGYQPGRPFRFRRDPTGARGHEAVPLEELASLAQPFLWLRLDEEAILRRMASEFGLGRLRSSARARFEAALAIAGNSPSTRC